MNPYIEKLKTYLAENEPNYGGGDIHTLLDMLYYYYAEFNPMEDETIRRQLRELYIYFDGRRQREIDRAFDLILDLCTEYQRLAFFEGIRTGARAVLELGEERGEVENFS